MIKDIEMMLLKAFKENVMGNTELGIYSVDRAFTVLDWNKKLEAITGISRQQALGKNLFGLSKFLDKLNREEDFNRIFSSGEPLSYKKDHFKVRLLPLVNAEGGVEAVLALLESTRRMAITELYNISEKMYSKSNLDDLLKEILFCIRNIFGFKRMGLALVDKEDRTIRGRVGLALPQSLMREMVYKLYDKPDPQENILSYIWREKQIIIIDDGSDRRLDRELNNKYGLYGTRIFIPIQTEGRTIGVIDIIADSSFEVSEDTIEDLNFCANKSAIAIKNFELLNSLRGESEKTGTILNSIAEAVIAIDEREKIILVNPSFEELFEVKSSQIVGLLFTEAIKNDYLEDLFSKAIERENIITGEMSNDSRMFYVTISPMKGLYYKVIGYVAVLQDITYLKEVDRMRSDFVSLVSHGLKSPLTAIRFYAEVLANGMTGKLNDKQQEFSNEIVNLSDNMATLISDILNLARIDAEAINFSECDLVDIITGTLSDFKVQATNKDIDIEFKPSSVSPVIVKGDRNLLKQVVDNLVSNAIKYTPQGRNITIEIQEGDRWVVMSVRDTGIGIDPIDQERIFDRFYRVRSKNTQQIEGTGLGLAIVKSIVLKHGGQAWMESEVGKGSTFYFTLPRYIDRGE